MARKLQIKRGTLAKLPTLAEGEMGFTTDEKGVYIGTGAGNVRVSRNESYIASTLEAGKWNQTAKTYSFETTYPVAAYDVEIQPNSTCTQAQIEAWGAALITGSPTSNVCKAIGEVPAINIPIIVKAVTK